MRIFTVLTSTHFGHVGYFGLKPVKRGSSRNQHSWYARRLELNLDVVDALDLKADGRSGGTSGSGFRV